MRRYFYFIIKKCRKYAACGVSQTPILNKTLKGAQSLYVSAEKALSIPGLATDLLSMTLRGQTKLNLNLTGSKTFWDQVRKVVNQIIVCIIAASLLLASSLLCTTNMQPKILGIPTIGFLGYLVAFVLGLILIIFSHKK